MDSSKTEGTVRRISETKEFQEGRAAFEVDADLYNNPYPLGSDARWYWANGWIAASEQDWAKRKGV